MKVHYKKQKLRGNYFPSTSYYGDLSPVVPVNEGCLGAVDAVVEMRNHRGLRRRRDDVTPAEQVRVTIDDGDLADSFSRSCSIDGRRRDSHVTDVSPRHSLCAESLDTHRLVTSSPDNGDVIADDRCSLVAMCQSFI